LNEFAFASDRRKAPRCRSFLVEILLGRKAGLDWKLRRKRVGKREASAVVCRRIEEPEPRLWRGSLNSSWSVPPQCQ